MGWFNEQIQERKRRDQAAFENGFSAIIGAVTGKRADLGNDADRTNKNAIGEILRFYGASAGEVPDSIRDLDEQLEFMMHPYGIMRRDVVLEPGWHKQAVGAMLGIRRSDGTAVALIPSGVSGYSFYDTAAGARRRVTSANEELFEREAVAFYKPLPQGKIGVKDLIAYIISCFSWVDFVLFVGAALAVSLVGLVLPRLTNILFSTVVDSGSIRLLTTVISFTILVSFGSQFLQIVKEMLQTRMETKALVYVEAAGMMRLLSLPASFFKKYSTGELSMRVRNIRPLASALISSMAATGLTSLFSLVQISQIFVFAPALVAPALCISAATVVFTVVTPLVQMQYAQKQFSRGAKENSLSYALIRGVQKIKLSGSEKRAFAKWSEVYAQSAQAVYSRPLYLRLNRVIPMGISLAGTIVLYAIAVQSGVSVAEYYAFTAAYAMVASSFSGLAGIAATLGHIMPILKSVKPILEAEPEVDKDKKMVQHITGGVELNNVSFRYSEDMPNVLDDLSLKIRPGQYVAVVGRTGCGKSTLMRVLLGFEKPQKGAVYYDGQDINTMDLKSLRQHIGVVTQDGKLFAGDILSNITLSAPRLSEEEAWEAAEMAGIAEDIRQMPMGMHTLISEGSGGISGGQRQRLMIARAIAPKPRLLLLDEATSALDNITQRVVSESLDRLKCTRIVIAHRLSTIRHCDRILVLDKGRVVEDGTYDELIAAGGFFAELVARQRLDAEDQAAPAV